MTVTAPFLEGHICPANERAMHVLNDGPSCPCEPMCVIRNDGMRVFIHRTDIIRMSVTPHEKAPKWWTTE